MLITPDAPNTCISFDSSSAPTTVRVTAPVRQVATPFAGIWGEDHRYVPVSASAQIQLTPGGRAQCGLCVVGPGLHEIQTGDINVSGADVSFNGDVSTQKNNGSVTVSIGNHINVEGTASGQYSPSAVTGQPHLVDPLANLTMPDYSILLPKADSCTGGPGIYDQVSPCPAGMQKGLYVFTGSTHDSGKNDVVAKGVTMYFTCGTPNLPHVCTAADTTYGELLFTGQAALSITAPTAGPTAGLAIIADRANQGTFDFRGNGSEANTGTIYAAGATLMYRGNGNGAAMDSLIVVGDVAFKGNNSGFNSQYSQSANVTIPSTGLHLSQ